MTVSKEQREKYLLNKVSGRLIVIAFDKYKKDNEGRVRSYWIAKCECGNEISLIGTSISSGNTKSCGCLLKDTRRRDAYLRHKLDTGFNLVYNSYIKGAKNRNYEFLLTKEEVRSITKLNCYYCNSKPSNIADIKSGNKDGIYIYNGIDRVENDKGYTLDNVVPCCKICNTMKTNHIKKDFINKIKEIYEHLKLNEINGR